MGPFPSRWMTAGHNRELWGDGGTYKAIPCEVLPPLKGPLDGSFAWLRAAPLPEHGMNFEQQPKGAIAEEIAARSADANGLGLVVPSAFVAFMTDADLYERVPSCTACYYEIGARLIAIPEHTGPQRLLRFLNDQQACYLWYLLLHPDGSHQVVRAWPEWKDEEPPDGASLEDMTTPRDIEICAPTFEEFIKRFWIENTIWFAVHNGQRLEGELRAYADAAKAATARADGAR
jgi:hypothetical protein